MMRTIAGALLLSSLLLSGAMSQTKPGPDGLLAAPYPGATAEAPVDPNSRRFFTRDPLEKVKAHYAKTIPSFEDMGLNTWYGAVMPFAEQVDILAKRGYIIGEGSSIPGAGVTITGQPVNDSYPVQKSLDALMNAYMLRFMGEETVDPATRMNDPELKKALGRYEYLLKSHYIEVKGKKTDEAIYDKFYTEQNEKAQKEIAALSEKMTSLSTQQKYDEASKVGDQMMAIMNRTMDATWQWDNAIKCLDEMARNAYATVISIDKHPTVWDLSGFQ